MKFIVESNTILFLYIMNTFRTNLDSLKNNDITYIDSGKFYQKNKKILYFNLENCYNTFERKLLAR